MGLRPRRGIRTRLLLYTIPLIVLPILLLGFFSYRSLKGGFEEQVQLEGEQLCQAAASRVEQKLDECYANMLVLQTEVAKEWESSSAFQLNGVMSSESTLTGRLAQRFVIRHSPFVQIRIVRADGEEMLVVRGLHPEQQSGSALHEPMFLQAVAMSFSKRIPIQFPVHTVNGKSVTTFSAPIFSRVRIDSLLGFVFLDLDVRFAERVVNEMNVFQSGNYVLFDDAGNIIAENSSTTFVRAISGMHSSQVYDLVEGTRDYHSATSLRLDDAYLTTRPVKEYIAFREPIPQERWSIAAVPTSSPLQAAFRRTQILFFLILGGALALGIMGTILISRNITRPIAQLAQATQRFATGNLESNIPVQSADEIGALTADFNTMASDLRVFLRERQTNETLLAIGRLSSSLVHDLRNPIEGLKLLSTELRKRMERTRAEYEIADTIHQSVERLSSFLNQSLDFARLTHPVFAPASIVAIAEEALKDVRAGEAEICARYAESLPLIEVDAVQIKRVLVNILQNAVEACRRNETSGVVELLIRSEDSGVKIEISDNGSGIPPEIREKIFEPFFSTKPDGHGLGLSFGRQIIRNHGGELALTSEVGKGTRFIAVIPIAQK